MSSGESPAFDCVSKIFTEMTLGPEPVDLQLGKKWLSKLVINGKLSNETKELIYGNKSGHNESEVREYVSSIRNLIELLEVTKNELIQVLVLLKYTWSDATTIVTWIVNSLKCSDIESQLMPQFPFANEFREIWTIEFPQFGRYFAKVLFSGYHCAIVTSSDDLLLPFYGALIELCHRAKLPHRVEVRHSFPDDYSELKTHLMERSCPMIITEFADVNSAVDCLCKSLTNYGGKVSWSVSHVLIQESVFDFTLSVLKSKLKAVVHGSRFDKRTELEFDENPCRNQDSCNNLIIYSPCSKSPVKLCIGWSGKDVDDMLTFCRSNGYISVMPYRNSADFKTMLGEVCGSTRANCPASVWSERISDTEIASCLQFSTVWINSHGVFHPLVPSDGVYLSLPNELKTTVYGPHFSPCNQKELPTVSSTSDLSHIIESNWDLVVNKANKAFDNWQKMSADKKFTFMVKLYKLLSLEISDYTGMQTGHRRELNKTIKLEADSVVKGLPAKAKVAIEFRPVGVITVHLLSYYSNINKDLNRFVISLLLHGNSVVIVSHSKPLLNLSINALSSLLSTSSAGLQDFSLLNFVEVTDFTAMVKPKFHKIRHIILGSNNNSPFPSWSESVFYISKQHNYLNNDEYLLRVSSLANGVWTS